MISRTLKQRFWKKVQKPDIEDGCWLWTGAKRLRNGRGMFRVYTDRFHRPWEAARAAWLIETGEDPGKLCVCHHCDNPRCVRFSHLYLGTHQRNIRDAFIRGLQPSGELAGRAKLTQRQVDEIRDRLKAGDRVTKIASDYGVTHPTVSLIKSGKNWKGVDHLRP